MSRRGQIAEPETLPRAGGPGLPPPAKGYGGDDSDYWKNQPQGRRGPRERLRRYRLGMVFALLSIFTLFVALTSAYVIRRAGGRFDAETSSFIKDWQPVELPAVLWLNTLLLAISSVTVELARRKAFAEPEATEVWLGLRPPSRSSSMLWLSLTLLLGAGFLAGQVVAWRGLMSQGVYAAGNPSSAFFYVLTGTHAVHLMGGMLALLWAAALNVLGRSLERRQIATDVSAWYWHAMGALWVYVFVLLRVMR